MDRSVFNENDGHITLRELVCLAELPKLEELVAKKYLCLASAAALTHRLLESRGLVFLPNSLHLDFRAGDGLLLLDPMTISSLELLEPNLSSQSPQALKGAGATVKSLFDVLNHTQTPQGARLLKLNLIQAPRDLNTILFRQSCIKEILSNEKLYFGLSTALQGFTDVESILSYFVRLSHPSISTRTSNTSSTSSGVRGSSGSSSRDPAIFPTNPTSTHSKNVLQYAHSAIVTLLKFKHCLNGLPHLQQMISISSHPLFTALTETLDDPDVRFIYELLTDSIADTTPTSGTGAPQIQVRKNIQQRDVIFALKDGVNGLLDAARQVYTERLEDIEQAVEELKLEYPSIPLQLAFNVSRGYHLRITESKFASSPAEVLSPPSYHRSLGLGLDQSVEGENSAHPSSMTPSSSHFASNLPKVFILRSRNRNRIECTTEELVAYNVRLSEAQTEIILLTSQLLGEVQMAIRERIGCIYKLGESIALLDLLFSFATYVTLSAEPCCCPEMSSSPTKSHIQIVKGYHPLILAQHGSRKFGSSSGLLTEPADGILAHPNTIRSSKSGSFIHIITGRNNSGKTTFLLQTAVLVLMAHMGCYIPATFASISLVDQILTCIGVDDDIIANADASSNSSSFFKEMRITSYILDSATSNSLVLLDEIGKSTNADDGLPICYAIVERLMLKGSQIFFATHFLKLASSLQSLYAAIMVHRMDFKAIIDPKTGVQTRENTFTLVSGCESDSGYGLQMASDAGWPSSLVARAAQIRENEVVAGLNNAREDGSDLRSQAWSSSSSNILGAGAVVGENEKNHASIARLRRMVYEQLKIAKQSNMASMELNMFLHHLAVNYREKLDSLQK